MTFPVGSSLYEQLDLSIYQKEDDIINNSSVCIYLLQHIRNVLVVEEITFWRSGVKAGRLRKSSCSSYCHGRERGGRRKPSNHGNGVT